MHPNLPKHLLLNLLLSIGAFACKAQDSLTDFKLPKPIKLDVLTSMKLWATYYHIHAFKSGGQILIVLNTDSLSGLYADTCDFCKAALEGTAFVTDDNGKRVVINYASTNDTNYVDCRTCKRYKNCKLNVERWGRTKWIITDGYGNGVQQYKLVPFRTIAVDQKKIPYGSVIFIPAIQGLKFDPGEGKQYVHDGYFFAGDTGSAIHDNHIDIFTGTCEKNPFPTVIKPNETGIFDVYIITETQTIVAMKKLHQHTKKTY